jgi:hypothetical protein
MADKKNTHVAVNTVQYHHEGVVTEIPAGTEFAASDVGDAAEIKRLEGLGAIKALKVAAKEADAAADAAAAAAAAKK